VSRLPGWFSRVDLIPFFLPAVLVLPDWAFLKSALIFAPCLASAGVDGLGNCPPLRLVAFLALVRFVELGFLFAILLGPFHI